jgi:hypothetical protein
LSAQIVKAGVEMGEGQSPPPASVGQSVLGAIQVSFYVGVMAAITCCVVLLKNRNVRNTP